MIGKAYIGKVVTQVWLKSIKLFDKKVNAQNESLKKLPGFAQAHKKICDENETR